tara:strand:- start:3728 stop:4069 length:342 start_codon:yes stop_codon:yes gene_type:complete
MKKDLNKIASIEKAIKDKYGPDAILNPRGSWTKEKEKKHIKALKLARKNAKQKKTISFADFKVKESKFRESLKQENVCPVCGSYSLDQSDDVYMAKFDCCQKCYILNIEGRNL